MRYTFTGTQIRDLPLVVAGLPILSKAYYATPEFDQTTLEPPLGSGPYKIGDFKQGAFVSYKRRDDYWAKDLPVNRGRYNFDELRYEYYRDRTAELESLKAGAFDLREEFTSRDWATAYDIAGRQGGPAHPPHAARREPVGRAGLLPQHAPAEARRRARAQGARPSRSTSSGPTRTSSTGSITRTESFFENSDMKARGQAEPGRAGAARAVPRPAAAGGVRASPTSRRSRTARGRTAGCCARPAAC